MDNIRIYFISFFFILTGHVAFTQRMDTVYNDNDTIYRFYYENGNISSEGPIQNGKPNGYWKNFYPDGTLKSEGNRIDGEKHGSFKFYNKKGDLTLEITYKSDLKHGLRLRILDKVYVLEEFRDDVKNGLTRYYNLNDSSLKKIVPYKDGRPHGIARKYSKKGLINEIIEYKNGKITSIQYVNRIDRNGKKQGKWVQFWSNGILKSEGHFLNGQKHGFFKFYARDGNLVKVEKYQNGYKLEKAPEVVELDERISYYPNGNIKRIGHYLDSTPEGIWQKYDRNGEVEETFVFKNGKVRAKGIIDKEGRKQGNWKEFYPNTHLLGKGQFKNGYRYGKWIFYHENGNVEQTGYYNNQGQLDQVWVWFYESGKLLRKEKYKDGERYGEMVELYEDGDTIAKGEYFENKRTGFWILKYGDYREEGEYIDGNRDGVWKAYYKNGQLFFIGSFIDGNPDGKHTWYWPNGRIKKQGNYLGYQKDGNWNHYDEKGNLIITITYTAGIETKYDGLDVTFED